jgi:hypothetical protein
MPTSITREMNERTARKYLENKQMQLFGRRGELGGQPDLVAAQRPQ